MRRKVVQLVHTLSYGDAISGEVLALSRVFDVQGWESHIVSLNTHPTYKGLTRTPPEIDLSTADELILHYSLGSPLNEHYRINSGATRTLMYHNLTPAHWFDGINPRVAADIRQGAEELPYLCRSSDHLLADSTFNAGELESQGFVVDVLPLPIDKNRWSEPPNKGFLDMVRGDSCIHLLHVGRIAPNKKIEDIIRIFYFLNKYSDRASKLWLVGIDIDTELYSFSLKRLVHDLGLTEVVNFVGCRADSEVRALYESCSVYVCTSEHEGFCLPVVEAMNFGLPVVAFAAGALPETIKDGGILVHEKKFPELAELLYEVSRNSMLRERLIRAGKKRSEELSLETFESNVTNLFRRNALPESRAFA